MLAMDVNDDAGSLIPRSALEFIASMLAPTEIVSVEAFHGHGRRFTAADTNRRHAALQAFVP
jgi:hypothetical protein